MKGSSILILVALYLVGAISGYTFRMDTETPPGVVAQPESWVLCFDTPETKETFCGSDRFDNIDSCIGLRDWLRETIAEPWQHTENATRNHRCNRAIDE